MHRSCTNFNLSLLSLSGWARKLHFFVEVCTSTYWYVLFRTNVEFSYCHVQSCTGMHQYVQVCTNLPDPVQGHRIPDDVYPLLWIYMVYPWICHVYTMSEVYIYMVYTRHIPGIYQKKGFQMMTLTARYKELASGTRSIFGTYHVYTWYIPCIYMVLCICRPLTPCICRPRTYTWNILG